MGWSSDLDPWTRSRNSGGGLHGEVESVADVRGSEAGSIPKWVVFGDDVVGGDSELNACRLVELKGVCRTIGWGALLDVGERTAVSHDGVVEGVPLVACVGIAEVSSQALAEDAVLLGLGVALGGCGAFDECAGDEEAVVGSFVEDFVGGSGRSFCSDLDLADRG